MSEHFREHFSYGSFLAIILFLLGNYIVYLILTDKVSTGVFLMVISLIIYVLNNVLISIFDLENAFNDFLENVAVMITFGLSTIVFGVMYYKQNPVLLFIILFYAVCMLLSLGRNNVMSLKNSVGWPVPLNGIFFPLVYFFYLFYFHDAQNTIFIFYYVTVGILSVSSYNFLGNIDAQSLAEKQDRRYQSFRNNISKDKDMSKYKRLLHHEEVKQEREAEEVFDKLAEVHKKAESEKDVTKAFSKNENALSKIIKHLIRKFHWIRGRDIPVAVEEINTIEEEIEDIRTNKIGKKEIEEVFRERRKEKGEQREKKHHSEQREKEEKHHFHLLPHHKNIKNIKPEDVKHLPRVSIEEAITMPLDIKEEEKKHKSEEVEEKEEHKSEQKEEHKAEDKPEFNFESSTFENKKRL